MDVVVCVKQIPNPDAPQAFDPASRTLLRPGPLVLDPSDSYSVEIALRIVEQAGGGEVTLVSIVPDGETAGIRTALAMGADKSVIVSDPALAGLDALGTAKILAAVVRRANPQLVLAATESTDGYTGTVPVQLAELLGYPAVTFAKHIEVKDGGLAIQRQTEEGYDEIECPLPAVVTVTAGVVEVRYPSFKGIMSAKSKPVEQLSVGDLGLDPAQLGAQGARQEIVNIEKAEVRASGQMITDEGNAHETIIATLESWKVL
jgi:electron transfer flavoprotein beta subunit